ncbi:signal peptidase I [Candidatus Babeliales bacterium]|nr:signal peptidase I [Candidatus Babeliales bacterium]
MWSALWGKWYSFFARRYQEKRSYFTGIIRNWNERGYYKEAGDFEHNMQRADQLTELIQSRAYSAETKHLYRELKGLYVLLNESSKNIVRQWVEALVVAGAFALFFRNFVFGLYHVPSGSAERTILVGDRVWGNKFSYRFGQKVKRGDMIILSDPTFKYDESSSFGKVWQKYIGIGLPFLGLKHGPDSWVKRAIALPGDTIEGKVEDGRATVYINGEKLDESQYVNPYPLLALKKSTGFLPQGFFSSFGLPGLFEKSEKLVFYSYDENESFKDQPFYYMEQNDIFLHPQTGMPWLKQPTDTTELDTFGPIKLPKGKYWAMGDNRRHSDDSRRWLFLDESIIDGRASFVVYSVDSEESWWLFELIKHPFTFWKRYVRWNRFGLSLSKLPGAKLN